MFFLSSFAVFCVVSHSHLCVSHVMKYVVKFYVNFFVSNLNFFFFLVLRESQRESFGLVLLAL